MFESVQSKRIARLPSIDSGKASLGRLDQLPDVEALRHMLPPQDRQALLSTCKAATALELLRQHRDDKKAAKIAWPWIRMRLRSLSALNAPGLCGRNSTPCSH